MSPKISLLFLFSLLSLSVTARPGHPFNPCNTLIVSTYSFSLRPNPNLHTLRPDLITVVSDFRPHLHHRFFLHHPENLQFDRPQLPHPHPHDNDFPNLGFSSLKDRTKDILSVVVSLLFGAACGALTAATMYLIWSLFNHRRSSHRSLDGFSSDDDDNDGHDEDIFNPKKKGYVAIPAAAPLATPASETS